MVLESHILVTKKKDGLVKGRHVAGGNKQRDFIMKEDASSPTVATESVLLSATIDAIKIGRCVLSTSLTHLYKHAWTT